MGGYVTLPAGICDCIKISNWGYIFTVGPPLADIKTFSYILQLSQSSIGEQRRQSLHKGAKELRKELRMRGFNLLNSESFIVPVVVGSDELCLKIRMELAHRGVLVGAIRSPAVKRGEALLRFSITSEMANCFEKIIQELEWARSRFGF